MKSSAHLKNLTKTSVSDENQNSVIEESPRHPNEIRGHSLSVETTDCNLSNRNDMSGLQNGTLDTSLSNGIITNDINLSLNHSTNIILADAIDRSNVIESEHEQNSVGSNPSSRESSGRKGRHRHNLPAGMKTGIKSVLKHGNPRDHMLANRQIKTVTFVESVTVVRVM